MKRTYSSRRHAWQENRTDNERNIRSSCMYTTAGIGCIGMHFKSWRSVDADRRYRVNGKDLTVADLIGVYNYKYKYNILHGKLHTPHRDKQFRCCGHYTLVHVLQSHCCSDVHRFSPEYCMEKNSSSTRLAYRHPNSCLPLPRP